MPVARRVGAQQHALGVEQRVQRGDLGGTDKVALRTGAAQHALHIVKPVDLVPVGGEPDGAAAVPARGVAGLRLQPLVEPGAVEMHLGQVEAADEMRDQPGRVPGRAGCEFALLDQDHVRPPLLGEVVEEPDPHDAAADHGDARMGFHPWPRSRIGRTGRRSGSTNGMTLDIATSPLRPTREPKATVVRSQRIEPKRHYCQRGADASGFCIGDAHPAARSPIGSRIRHNP